MSIIYKILYIINQAIHSRFIDLCCSIFAILSTITSLSSISNQQCKYNALYKTQVDLGICDF